MLGAGTADQMHAALIDKLGALPPDTVRSRGVQINPILLKTGLSKI